MNNNISDNISEKLEDAMQEALDMMDNPFEQLRQEKTVKVKSKKDSHIVATVEWDTDDKDVNIPKKIDIPDSILIDDYNSETVSNYLSDYTGFCHKGFTLSWPERHENLEEFCQWEIEKAHLYDKEEPDFDYRMFYSNGDHVYLVRHFEEVHKKEILYLKIRKIYARMMIGTVDKQCSQCIGFSERDNIFFNKFDAVNYFNSIQAEDIEDGDTIEQTEV